VRHVILILGVASLLHAQTGAEWPTYHGSYSSTHHSALEHIHPGNVKDLELKWVWQAQSLEKFESTPLVVNGVMYFTEPSNNIIALDPATGREYWTYEHKLPEVTYPCCGKVNRGLALSGGILYMGTLDMKLLAIDAATGQKKWESTVGDYKQGYALAHAPLVVKDKVIVGTAGGELGIRGYIAAFSTETGKELWRFKTIPEPGEPGHETWENDAWKTGGASIWLTGSYDPELNLTYWGVGNPGPDWNPSVRPGDNLYSDSVVALDATTGKLKWHFQFTPHDEWDWDAVQTPVLMEGQWNGKQRKMMLWGNRNGFYYVLDRASGEFLHGVPFVKQTWAEKLDAKGRPIKIPGRGPSAQGTVTYPGVQGGTNWFAPSYSPKTGLFYLNAWEDYPGTYFSWDQKYETGKWYVGGGVKADLPPTRRFRLNRRDAKAGYGAVRALKWDTGERVWEFKMTDVSEGGILTTAANLVFTGNREGYVLVLDARDGKLLWSKYLGGQAMTSPITYLVDGKQYVTLGMGHSLFTFGTR
jgi:alcohol dehydrogenase (cytochrome c)